MAPEANMVWKSLYIDAVYDWDKEACMKWFSERIGEAKDDDLNLEPNMMKDFFINNILEVYSAGMASWPSGHECFRRFFEAVNIKEKKLSLKMEHRLTEDLTLIGLDCLWRIIIAGSEEDSDWGGSYLLSIYTNLGPSLHSKRASIRDNFVAKCFE